MSFLSKLFGSSASSDHIKVLGIEAFKLGNLTKFTPKEYIFKRKKQ